MEGYSEEIGGLESIIVKRGTSRVDVLLNDLKSLKITRRNVDGKVEAITVKTNGDKFTAALRMKTFWGEQKPEYGAVIEDDRPTWTVPYGIEGLSLLPFRKIVLINNKVQKNE